MKYKEIICSIILAIAIIAGSCIIGTAIKEGMQSVGSQITYSNSQNK